MTKCLSPEDILIVYEKANEVASTSDLRELLNGMLSLVMEICQAPFGCVLIADPESGRSNMVVENGIQPPEKSVIVSIPIVVHDQISCTVQLSNPVSRPNELIEAVINRLGTEIAKTIHIENSRNRSERLKALVDIVGQISSSLDVDQILGMIIDYARRLLNTEAASLFLIDEQTGDLVLRLASNVAEDINLSEVRVPPGKGVIGRVVEEGIPIIVPDVRVDEHHYHEVDQQSGFTTRSILAIPLMSREVNLGRDRGSSKEHVIGGVEAINKLDLAFGPEDVELFGALANQAATVLEVARLYTDANELFMDVLRALTAAIDAKDPYTKGHSQRVCDISVGIAHSLGLPPETILRVRIGSLFHDVGKLGVPDAILIKPKDLTDHEYEIIKQHPNIGAKILSQVRLMSSDLLQMAEQHHERLDGSGYPNGLSGEQITLPGRIAAVADVFDAMTSHRAYRKALSADVALNYLQDYQGAKFDESCVIALTQAYENGSVRIQKDWVDTDIGVFGS